MMTIRKAIHWFLPFMSMELRFGGPSGRRSSAMSSFLMHNFLTLRTGTPGLEITAGQRTMSGQNGDLSGQNLPLTVMLTGHPIIYFNKSKINWISLYFCGKIITLSQINAHPTVDMVD